MKKVMLIACLAILAGCAAKQKPLSELSNKEVCWKTGEDKAFHNENAVKADIKEIVKRKLTKKECAPEIERGLATTLKSVHGVG